jgi:hypothetical protein
VSSTFLTASQKMQTPNENAYKVKAFFISWFTELPMFKFPISERKKINQQY